MYWTGRRVVGGSFHGLAYDLIKQQIHLGSMRPGEQFPAERKLAETLGISRATLREALKRMEADGYVVASRGARGGTFVADAAAIDAIALSAILSRPERVWRALEFLGAILEAAVVLASARRSPADLSALARAVEALRGASDSGALREAEYLTLSAAVQASMNGFHAEAADKAIADLFHPIAPGVLEARKAQLVDLAEALTSAIGRREAEGARVAAQRMVAAISDHVLHSMVPPRA